MNFTVQPVKDACKLQGNVATTNDSNLLGLGRQIKSCIRINGELSSWNVGNEGTPTDCNQNIPRSVDFPIYINSVWVYNLDTQQKDTKSKLRNTQKKYADVLIRFELSLSLYLSTTFDQLDISIVEYILVNTGQALELGVFVGDQCAPIMRRLGVVLPTKAVTIFELVSVFGCVH